MRRRLDAELVRRGLARSREHAVELVEAGRVRVGGGTAGKPATQVDTGAPVTVVEPAGEGDTWVSRGARKLDGALDRFESDGRAPTVVGRRCLDAGASTGGFTQVLLRRGAREVVALDVGYGQLAWELRTDPRVTVLERVNVRHATAATVGGPVELVVADLSFISLRLVLPALDGILAPGGDMVLLVKPQFEAGRSAVGRGGVVSDPATREAAVVAVAETGLGLGLAPQDVTASSLPGPAGNVEVVLWLSRDPAVADWRDRAHEAARGPVGNERTPA